MRTSAIPPKQARSAETVERILDACEELLRDRPFDELTVLDIRNAADVSSSSMYARFRGKDAILLAVLTRYRERVRAALIVAMGAAAERDDLTVGVTAGVFTAVMVEFFRDNSHVASALNGSPITQRSNHDLYDGVVGVVVDVVPLVVGPSESSAVLDRATLTRKIEFIVRCTGAIVIQGIGNGVAFAERMGLDDGQLIDELTALVLGYLGEHFGLSAAELGDRPVSSEARELLRAGVGLDRISRP